MKTINHLIVLANKLDALQLTREVDFLDSIITNAAKDEDFDNFLDYIHSSQGLKDMSVPVQRTLTQIPEPLEVVEPLEDDVLSGSPQSPRIDEIKRRHELMQLKKMLADAEDLEQKDDGNTDLLDGFEDEDGMAEDKPTPTRHMLCDRCGVRRKFHYNRNDGWTCSACEKTIDYADDAYIADADDELLGKKLKEDEHGTLETIVAFLKENPAVLEKLLLVLI